jgi:uncharacterized membrane protein
MSSTIRSGRKSSLLSIAVISAVGVLLIGWLLNTPEGLLGKADAVGYAVCHRIDLRSFNINQRQMPLCARCSGMYLGALLGLAYQGILRRRCGNLPPKSVAVVLGLLLIAFAVDGLNSFLSFFPAGPPVYSPQNWLRLATGTGMGLVIAAYLFPAFNQTVWQDWQAKPALDSLKTLAGLLILAAILDLIILVGNPWILYILALLSAAGVLIILTMTYTMLGLIIFSKENRYQNGVQLLMPLVGGFGLALMQIAVLDFLRFIFTGTWDGFHLG